MILTILACLKLPSYACDSCPAYCVQKVIFCCSQRGLFAQLSFNAQYLLLHASSKPYFHRFSFQCILSMSYLAITDVSVLMNYVGFVEALFLGVVMAGLVRLRYKQPNLERPIKVHISLPLISLFVCIFLVALPFYERPWETGIGTAVTLTGIPVYMMILFCSDKPRSYLKELQVN
ncbi:hypothetical protein CEXT_605081 [Caerostris extrusa]|uniref:Uncharacterized protein n=1 Tax=Caerostris extrusa TaxID=172846 RepID=A0AAV4Y961_CAEEX|nr:hypothetical protein CEXT_605081 [Caerostris extrusa]